MATTNPQSGARKRIAVVRVRGRVHVRSDIADTMKLMNLNSANHCVIIDNRPQYEGMIKKIKDYVAFGEVKSEVMEKLLLDKGRLDKDERLTEEYVKEKTKKTVKDFVSDFMDFKAELKDIDGIKPVFRLHPPRGGHERKGIKKPYSVGGVLGYRGDKINNLLEDMV